MKKLFIFILFVFLIIPVFAKNIIICHTNDIHNVLEEQEASFINPDFPPVLGGIYSLSTAIQWEKKNAKKNNDIVLVFDSGNFSKKTLKNNSIDMSKEIIAFNYIGYDAINLGIDEISAGEKEFKKSIEKFTMPVLLGNVVFNSIQPGTNKYMVIEKQGVRIGVFGLTTEYAVFNLSEDVLNQIEILRIQDEAEKMVKILEEMKCDIIIGLTSIGFENDKKLAESVKGIDIILGGYEGWGLKKPFETPKNHTIIFRSYGDLSSYDRLCVEIDDMNKIKNYNGKSITLFKEEFPCDYKLKNLLNNKQEEK